MRSLEKDFIMAAKIVVVGSFNADLTAYVPRLPKPGETLMGTKFVTGPGGKGSNQAVAAARLGAQVAFVGRVGHDEFAGIGLRLWQTEGINIDHVVWDEEQSTGVAPIWVDENGENSIIVIPGANMAINAAHVDKAAEVIAQADILVVQLEIPVETVHYALKVAKQHGIRTILNPAPAEPLSSEMLLLADYITPNQTELETLTGETNAEVETAARSLLQRDDQTVIVTLGSQGARWITRTDTGLIPTFPVQVVDTTGAGDAFNGGLAVALAEGQPLENAVAFATATASLSVTRPGTSNSMPRREEVDALLKTNGR